MNVNPNAKEISFFVTTLPGQKRPYADTISEYLVQSKMPFHIVRNYCTRVLHPCSRENGEPAKTAADYFSGSYEFKKINSTDYTYKVVEPYND